ncbi:MAG TPA: hypothetical protein VNA57_06725 [Acidimicrobiales bacterium]|nr:hypothetical protein [Acidimicrobiales bacterium]
MAAVVLIPWVTHFSWLLHHDNRAGLYVGAASAITCASWSIIDLARRERIRWGALVAILAVIIQIL